MQSYYGGRACRIKGIKVPIMFVDFTSQYATCNSLLGTWDYMIARDVKVQDDTEEVRKFLNSVTLQKMFNRATDLNFFALVEPHGDMLPVRAVYDVEGESTNIGINPLTSKVPIWYSGPDLAASKTQTGRSPKIVKAVRITPVGVQEGLKPITLGNNVHGGSEELEEPECWHLLITPIIPQSALTPDLTDPSWSVGLRFCYSFCTQFVPNRAKRATYRPTGPRI